MLEHKEGGRESGCERPIHSNFLPYPSSKGRSISIDHRPTDRPSVPPYIPSAPFNALPPFPSPPSLPPLIPAPAHELKWPETARAVGGLAAAAPLLRTYVRRRRESPVLDGKFLFLRMRWNGPSIFFKNYRFRLCRICAFVGYRGPSLSPPYLLFSRGQARGAVGEERRWAKKALDGSPPPRPIQTKRTGDVSPRRSEEEEFRRGGGQILGEKLLLFGLHAVGPRLLSPHRAMHLRGRRRFLRLPPPFPLPS